MMRIVYLIRDPLHIPALVHHSWPAMDHCVVSAYRDLDVIEILAIGGVAAI